MKRALLILCAAACLAAAPLDSVARKLAKLPSAAYAPKETRADYLQRMQTISTATKRAAGRVIFRPGRRELRALALTVWYRETRFAVDVHQGKRGHFGSDRGLAKCLGQLHTNAKLKHEAWRKLGGADLKATERCAVATMRAIASKARTCRTQDVGRILDAYGSGNCGGKLPSKERRERIRLYQRIRKWPGL